jgi:hypothetical protein
VIDAVDDEVAASRIWPQGGLLNLDVGIHWLGLKLWILLVSR